MENFGKISAGVRLTKILSEIKFDDPSLGRKYSKKVSSIIVDCYRIVKELSYIPDSRVYEMIWNPCCKSCIEKTSHNSLPEIIKEDLNNAIISIFRNARRMYFINHKDTSKKDKAKLTAIYNKYIAQYESLLKGGYNDK